MALTLSVHDGLTRYVCEFNNIRKILCNLNHYVTTVFESNIQNQVTECDTIFLFLYCQNYWFDSVGMFQVQDGSFSDSVEIISNKPTY